MPDCTGTPRYVGVSEWCKENKDDAHIAQICRERGKKASRLRVRAKKLVCGYGWVPLVLRFANTASCLGMEGLGMIVHYVSCGMENCLVSVKDPKALDRLPG